MGRLLRATSLVAIAVLLSCSPTLAGAPPWTYIEAGYLNVDPDSGDAGDNVFAGGSFGFLKSLHANARYIDGDYSNNTSFTYWEFGAGWHGALGEKADLLAEARWVDAEVSNIGDDGLGFSGGIRWKALDILELDGFVNWVDYDTAGSTESYEVQAIVDVWRLGIGASAELQDDANQYALFARFNFGPK